jgi:hypothetical protein
MAIIGRSDKKIQVQFKDINGKSRSCTIYGLDCDSAYIRFIDLMKAINDAKEGEEIVVIYKK